MINEVDYITSNIDMEIPSPKFQSFNESLLIDHDPISINSNEDFSEFAGSGTPEDPYRIENLKIQESHQIGDLIYIAGVDVSFIIYNCLLISPNTPGIGGIEINGIIAEKIIIENNVILYCTDNGIRCDNSRNLQIGNNTISNRNLESILLNTCDNCLIDNNYVMPNSGGIASRNSDDNQIVNNKLNEINGTGIIIDGYSHHNSLLNNTISFSSEYGIQVNGEASYIDILGNLISDSSTGIQFSGFCSNCRTISNEIFNFFTAVEAYQCEKIEIRNNIIKNGTRYGNGISILEDISNITIADNEIQNILEGNGINIYSGNNYQITNNLLENFIQGNGIYIENASNALLANNKIENAVTCIAINHVGSGLVIKTNYISNGTENGLSLSESNYCDLLISNNTFTGNNLSAILIDYINNVEISGNHFISNLGNGIELSNSDFNTIAYNSFISNGYAIFFGDLYSTQNIIYYNRFINNTGNHGQIFCVSTENYWSSPITGQGNYWNDHDNIDNNQDTIADSPYKIHGNTETYDDYPLAQDFVRLCLKSPELHILNSDIVSSNGIIILDWDEIEEASEYWIYRSFQEINWLNASLELLSKTTRTQFRDVVNISTEYHYVVLAINGLEHSAISNSVSISIILVENQIPGFSFYPLILCQISAISIIILYFYRKNKCKYIKEAEK